MIFKPRPSIDRTFADSSAPIYFLVSNFLKFFLIHLLIILPLLTNELAYVEDISSAGSNNVNAANSINNTENILNINALNLTSLTSPAVTNSSSFLNYLGRTAGQAALSNTTNIAVESVEKDESFEEALKNQGKNILIAIVAKVGAQQIGKSYHLAVINKITKLLLYGGLGCANAVSGGNNC